MSATAEWVAAADLCAGKFRATVGEDAYARHTAAWRTVVGGWSAEGVDLTNPDVRLGVMAGLSYAYACASAFKADQDDKTPWAVLAQVADALHRVGRMDA